MGSSRDIAIGSAVVVCLLLGNLLQDAFDPKRNKEEFHRLAVTATFFAGVTQAALGFLRIPSGFPVLCRHCGNHVWSSNYHCPSTAERVSWYSKFYKGSKYYISYEICAGFYSSWLELGDNSDWDKLLSVSTACKIHCKLTYRRC